MSDRLRVVLATNNPSKVTEIRAILGTGPELAIDLLTLADFPGIEPAAEDGETFEENATKKAMRVWRHTGLVSIADDSGLEVAALDGRPGIFSARFAGLGATHEANNRKLLGLLEGVPPARRGARFVCVAALVTFEGQVSLHRGTLEGVIADAPRGKGGFGYDPIFYLPDRGKTVAELGEADKNAISHRALAFTDLRRRLAEILPA